MKRFRPKKEASEALFPLHPSLTIAEYTFFKDIPLAEAAYQLQMYAEKGEIVAQHLPAGILFRPLPSTIDIIPK